MQCWKCSSKPKLLLREVNSAEKFTNAQFGCWGCGVTVKPELNKFYECGTCKDYRLCGDCRFCSNGHAMDKTVQLINISSGYGNNGFICNGCNASSRTDIEGIWHCSTCQYDICIKCLE